MKKVQRYAAVLMAVLVVGCASMLSSEPSRVNPTDLKYIEAETQLKNAYNGAQKLAKAEKRARAAGATPGSVITKAEYDGMLDRFDNLKTVIREGYSLTAGSCLDVTKFKDVDLTGCLSREQIALVLLTILSKYNEGG